MLPEEIHHQFNHARDRLESLGLIAPGWTMAIRPCPFRWGCCRLSAREVELSAEVALVMPLRVLRALIAHELSHAVAGPVQRSHGRDYVVACHKVAKALPEWRLIPPDYRHGPAVWGRSDIRDWRKAFTAPLRWFPAPRQPEPLWQAVSANIRARNLAAQPPPPVRPTPRPIGQRRAFGHGLAALHTAILALVPC